MLNERWAKRILRAKKNDVVASSDVVECKLIDRETSLIGVTMGNCVKGHEKIMNYLQKENESGHPYNLDMLVNSFNLNQHLRESFLGAEVTEDEFSYTISFPMGTKTIEYKLSRKAVDNE